jgi:hypothetical protein
VVRDGEEPRGSPDPLGFLRENGYLERIIRERHERNIGTVALYA